MYKENINIPMQKPWPWVISDETNGYIVLWVRRRPNRYDVTTGRIYEIILAGASTSNNGERVLGIKLVECFSIVTKYLTP
jgi:hypothetical protein